MIRTPLCDVLGADVPVIQAPLGPWPSLELSVAVSNAGGLGSLGTALRPLADLRREWAEMAERTGGRPFAINHTARPLDERRSGRAWRPAPERSPSRWATRVSWWSEHTTRASCSSSRSTPWPRPSSSPSAGWT